MKFPELYLSGIPSANSIISAYVEIRDLMCESTNMTLYGCIFAGNDWTESGASWSNVNANSYTEMPNAYADICYSNGASLSPSHRYSINITQAVKSWKTGFYSQAKGIILKADDSVEYGGSALYKTFASYDRSSNRPSLVVNYNSFPVSETLGITSGNYYYVQNVYSGMHLDVDSSGQTYGTRLIQFRLTGAPNQKFQFLYVGSGEYEIKPSYALGMNLTADSTGAVYIAGDNNSNAQRWYIYLSDSYYFFINKEYNTKKLSVNQSTSATNVTISNNEGYYWYVGGSDKSVSMDLYYEGVRLAKLYGQYFYDYTIPINILFANAVVLCGEHRCMNYTQYCELMMSVGVTQILPGVHLGHMLGSFEWFYNQVNHGRVWDVKLQNRWEEAMPNVPYLGLSTKFIFRGICVTAEDLGNIMYGYTGRATGFGDVTLYWGGGVAKKGSLNDPDVNTPPNYGDDENDHISIELGYNFFNSDYPDYPEVGYNGIPVEEGILAAIADLLINPGT